MPTHNDPSQPRIDYDSGPHLRWHEPTCFTVPQRRQSRTLGRLTDAHPSNTASDISDSFICNTPCGFHDSPLSRASELIIRGMRSLAVCRTYEQAGMKTARFHQALHHFRLLVAAEQHSTVPPSSRNQLPLPTGISASERNRYRTRTCLRRTRPRIRE